MLATLDLPPELTPVAEALESSLARVAQRFDAQLDSDLDAVADLIAHLAGYRGKMLRPSLVLLFAMAAGDQDLPLEGRVNDAHIAAAAVVEMVHMATLVHDDVLDEAELRRKNPTISHLRGNEAAVILGDYLIAAAYHLCSQIGDHGTSLAIARASMTVCAGELLQLSHREDFQVSAQTYFDIIDRKTGELVGLACELGARHAGADEIRCCKARQFGQLLGRAFQIQDDLLDLLGDEAVVGKTLHRDLDLGKATLPIIRCLESDNAAQRERCLSILQATAGGDADAQAPLREELDRTGAIARARADAVAYVEEAKALLDSFPDSDIRRTLDAVAGSVTSRTL